MRFIHLLAFGLLLSLFFQSCTFNDLDDDATLSGTVTDYTGNGIADADVKITFLSGIVETKTGVDGNYFVQFSNKGASTVQIRKRGYEPIMKQVAFIAGDNEILNIEMMADIFHVDFSVDLKNTTVDFTEGSLLATVKTNADYTVVSNGYWIKCLKDKDKVTINYEENALKTVRTAQIQFTAGDGAKRNIVITQKANPAGI